MKVLKNCKEINKSTKKSKITNKTRLTIDKYEVYFGGENHLCC